jgi:hypothetical protein
MQPTDSSPSPIPSRPVDTVIAADAAGYVHATVRRGGRLHALSINANAMYDLSSAQLAAACLEAVGKAQSMAGHPGRLQGRADNRGVEGSEDVQTWEPQTPPAKKKANHGKRPNAGS